MNRRSFIQRAMIAGLGLVGLGWLTKKPRTIMVKNVGSNSITFVHQDSVNTYRNVDYVRAGTLKPGWKEEREEWFARRKCRKFYRPDYVNGGIVEAEGDGGYKVEYLEFEDGMPWTPRHLWSKMHELCKRTGNYTLKVKYDKYGNPIIDL